MLKRAVITGMGVISPNGIGKTAFCRAILAGTSGVKQITRFDTSDLPVKIAGEIRDFNSGGLDIPTLAFGRQNSLFVTAGVVLRF